jgi:cell wall-associated NlpC family hydrolase
MSKLGIAALIMLLLNACQANLAPSKTAQVQAIIETLRQDFAPDKRVAIWEIEASPFNQGYLLKGKSNLPKAKQLLLQQLDAAVIPYTDSIQLLPDQAALGAQIYGLVNLSACNIRSQPKHSAELATQSTLGTILRIWEQSGEWYRVQTPDGYLGWLDPGGLQLLTASELAQYQSASRLVYLPEMGFAYQGADINSRKVSDLLAGNLLVAIGTTGAFTKVKFPDERIGYVRSKDVSELSSWLDSRQATVDNILTTAQAMLGRPYLWGGTSGKGMDCSGFTKTVFYLNGLLLPRDASQQVHVGQAIETDDDIHNLQAGDLLFFGRKANESLSEKITHVAIYMGDNQIIHATGQVKIESLNPEDENFAPERLQTFVRAKRFLEQPEQNGIPRLASSPWYQ